MNLIERAKALATTVIDSGKARVESVRTGRQRTELIAELGELTYRKHRGDPVDETALDPVFAELDRMEAAAAFAAAAADDEDADAAAEADASADD